MSTAGLSDPALRENLLRVRQALGWARLEDWAVLEMAGPDAERFLQNRLSNDVLALQPGQGQLNAALDRQAKIQGVFSLHRTEHGFTALIEQSAADQAISGILKYRILEQVTIQKSTNVVIFSVQGPRVIDWLPEAADIPEFGFRETVVHQVPVRVIRRSLSGEDGLLLLVSEEQADTLQTAISRSVEALDGVAMTPEMRDVLRVEAGWPAAGIDYDADTLLPETGLERLAVSYGKGCYLGQETVARVKTYGTLPQALAGIQFEPDAPLPERDSAILADGKRVGTVKSAVFSPTLNRPIALAYLGKTERVPGRLLDVRINDTPTRITVTLLPFVDNRAAGQSAQGLLDEGLRLFTDGYEEEAIRHLHRAIERDPALVPAYEALGVILSRHERYDEAIALMNRVLGLDPDHVLAHTNLSVYYMKLGDKEKAEEEKALATTAAFRKKMQESGLTFDPEAERRKKEEATRERIRMFEEALRFNPDDPLGNFGLGSGHLELKQYEQAIDPFEKVIRAQPKHTVAYLSLGKAYEGTGQTDKARDIYRRGIEMAAAKGDLMPLKEMQARLENLPAQ